MKRRPSQGGLDTFFAGFQGKESLRAECTWSIQGGLDKTLHRLPSNEKIYERNMLGKGEKAAFASAFREELEKRSCNTLMIP